MKFKKRIFSFMTAVVLLLQINAFALDEAVPAENLQEENPMEKVEEYSNYMLKTMVKTYAKSIANNYYYGIEDDELLYSVICNTIDNGDFNINNAVEAMINRLGDEHADFYTREEYAAMTEGISGQFSGIGVVITQNDNGIVVISVYEDSPAEKGGVLAGDCIIGVNGQSTAGMDVNAVRDLVVGESGSSVELTLRRGNREITAVCVRGAVTVKHTETKMLTDDIAYLKLTEFAQTAPKEVAEYVSEIQSNLVKKLVIDLRDNPGGDLDAALAIARTFISAGKIAELRYRDPADNKFLYSDNTHAPRLKIAVLVNENSASASEFLSMAFQTRGGAKIVGTKTFGKGSMQVLTNLLTGAGMKYTIGEFFSIKGDRVHTVGITPDIVVENEFVAVDETTFTEIDYNRIEEGSKGGDMTLALEQRLYALGYTTELPDEVFDENTEEAVKNLQAIEGFEMTGIPGFYEYLYLNDCSYKDLYTVTDHQLDAAIEYLNKK